MHIKGAKDVCTFKNTTKMTRKGIVFENACLLLSRKTAGGERKRDLSRFLIACDFNNMRSFQF